MLIDRSWSTVRSLRTSWLEPNIFPSGPNKLSQWVHNITPILIQKHTWCLKIKRRKKKWFLFWWSPLRHFEMSRVFFVFCFFRSCWTVRNLFLFWSLWTAISSQQQHQLLKYGSATITKQKKSPVLLTLALMFFSVLSGCSRVGWSKELKIWSFLRRLEINAGIALEDSEKFSPKHCSLLKNTDRVIKPVKLFSFRKVGLKMLCNLRVSCYVHQSRFQGVHQEEVLLHLRSLQIRYCIIWREIYVC